MNNTMTLVSGCALAALVSGCVVVADTEERGTLTALWTVDNTTDPGACSYYARDPDLGMDFELVLYNDYGDFVTEEQEDCRSFSLSIDLYRDLYQGEATMVDPVTDEALSTTLPLRDIRVGEDVETTVDIDFPPSSFLYLTPVE